MTQEWKPENDDAQMPLGVGGGDVPMDEPLPSGPKLRINSSTLALICAFGAALGVLYFLGQQARPHAASASETAQSQELSTSLQEWVRRHPNGGEGRGPDRGDTLVGILTHYFDNNAAGADEGPVRDPWAYAQPAPPPQPGVIAATQPVVNPDPLVPPDPLLVEASKEYSTLKLQLVMVGNPSSSSSAMINNQLVHVGSQFKYLTVSEIQADCVILSYTDRNTHKDQLYRLGSGKSSGN